AVSRLEAPDADWRSLVVDHATNASLILLRTREGKGEGGLLAFWTQPGEWALRTDRPAFRLADAWRDVFPTLETDTEVPEWGRLGQAWCQARSLPEADVERCELMVRDCRLVVQAPRRLLERLQALRSDALRGRTWLLSKEGFVRRAVLMELTESGAQGP